MCAVESETKVIQNLGPQYAICLQSCVLSSGRSECHKGRDALRSVHTVSVKCITTEDAGLRIQLMIHPNHNVVFVGYDSGRGQEFPCSVPKIAPIGEGVQIEVGHNG